MRHPTILSINGSSFRGDHLSIDFKESWGAPKIGHQYLVVNKSMEPER